MALGLTQPLTEISTRNISLGEKASGAYGWQPYYRHVSTVLKSGSLNLLEPSGPVQACNGIALPLPLTEVFACYSRTFKTDWRAGWLITSNMKLYIELLRNITLCRVWNNYQSFGWSSRFHLQVQAFQDQR